MKASTIRNTITRARKASDARMLDTVTVTRPGESTLVGNDLEYTAGTEVYAGPGWLARLDELTDPQRRADIVLTDTTYVVVVPHASGDYQIGDTVTVSETSKQFRVVNVPTNTWKVDIRLSVEEVVDGG